jgi:hypothetical protein
MSQLLTVTAMVRGTTPRPPLTSGVAGILLSKNILKFQLIIIQQYNRLYIYLVYCYDDNSSLQC